jgi:hypothetical protein
MVQLLISVSWNTLAFIFYFSPYILAVKHFIKTLEATTIRGKCKYM